MDRTEASPEGAPLESQSRLSPVLLWVFIAAAVFRVVTAVMDRGDRDSGGGLVQWQPREKASALSLASRKPILYDFTAAWCGPCHLLDRDWEDASIAQKVHAGFIPVRVVDRQREDGKNSPGVAEMLRTYDVTGFPTLVVAEADGRLIRKVEGYPGRAALLQFLQPPTGR